LLAESTSDLSLVRHPSKHNWSADWSMASSS